MTTQYLAIHNKSVLAEGSLAEIINKIKAFDECIEPIVINHDNCKRIEFSWHGSAEEIIESCAEHLTVKPKTRGRPKLGVTSKEVTLLPRHWEWLSTQRGGASATLRRLIDDAQKNVSTEDIICLKQQQLDSFMMLFLGDEPGFEEASRALYRNSKVSFEATIEKWPKQIKLFVTDKFNGIANLHNGQI